ncbi:MAG TPA: hypothetical protein VFP50_18175 [Anaeromyxobacteraceae bacterium]|nr:hypothetical protein [Anaeromyxobacteraceae bacterium]
MPEKLPEWAVPIDEKAPPGESLPSWARLAPEATAGTPVSAADPSAKEPQTVARQHPDVPASESAARGGLQGLSMGWGDELSAGLASAMPFLDREATAPTARIPGDSLLDRYLRARAFYRGRNEAAEAANPGSYVAGIVGGSLVPALATSGAGAGAGAGAAAGRVAGGAKALLQAAGQGVVAGAGFSDASTPFGIASDSALGGALGVAGYGAGKALEKGASYVGGALSRAIDAARARAGVQAAKEVGEQIQSAAGQLGAETQKGSRYVENLMRLEESMTPEQKALYEGLKAKGVVPGLQQSVAQGTLDALPQQAGSIAAKQAALDALREGAEQATAERAQGLMRPQFGTDVKSFLKSYAEPLAWSYAGNKLAEWMGATPEERALAAGAAGVIGGRTRAGKALMARVTRPGNQIAMSEVAGAAARGLSSAAQPIVRFGVPAAAMAFTSEAKAQPQSTPEVLQGLVSGKAQPPPALAPYLSSLRDAASRGGDALAANHFLLYNNDPKYRAAMDSISQGKEPATQP